MRNLNEMSYEAKSDLIDKLRDTSETEIDFLHKLDSNGFTHTEDEMHVHVDMDYPKKQDMWNRRTVDKALWLTLE